MSSWIIWALISNESIRSVAYEKLAIKENQWNTSSTSPSASQPPPRIGRTSCGIDEVPSIWVIKPFPQKTHGVPFKGQKRQMTLPDASNWWSSFLERFRVKQNCRVGKKFWQEKKDLGLSAQILELPPTADVPNALVECLLRRHKRKMKMKIKRTKRSRGKAMA